MSINPHLAQHEMHLEKTHPSGAEEWACAACGRRFVMQWPPAYQRVILEAGDEAAVHSGGKGGLQIGSPQVSEAEAEPPISAELRAAIEEALKDIDFDDLTNPDD